MTDREAVFLVAGWQFGTGFGVALDGHYLAAVIAAAFGFFVLIRHLIVGRAQTENIQTEEN